MMAPVNRKGLLYILKCAVVFVFLVYRSNGLSLESVMQDLISARDVESDENDINTNIGEHLENSVKKVHANITSNALRMICRMLPCSDWSAWTACGSITGRYGTRTRTRECGYEVMEACKEDMIGNEKEKATCMINIPWCPLDYNYTRHGYCVKLYNTAFKSWFDAQIQCESESGHLVNIDTETKSDDIDETFDDVKLLSIYAWIDGIRRTQSDEWQFKSGLRKAKFSNWYIDHPREDSFPICKCMIRSGIEANFEWRSSYVCGNRENFICEIKK